MLGKMAKKSIAAVIVLCLLASLTACASGGSQKESTDPPQEPQSSVPAAPSAEETETSPEETLPPKPVYHDPLEDAVSLKLPASEQFAGKDNGYTFRVGFGKGVITPPVGTQLTGYSPSRPGTSVHDDLNIVICVIEQDGKTVLIGAMDTCNCGDAVAPVKALISEATGIPVDNMHIAATHTHSGPNTFMENNSEWQTDILRPAAVAAAVQAVEGLQWAEMGIGTIESQVGINRRQSNKRGIISLGQDPNGIYDPTMTVIAFRNHEGKSIGNIVHYGCHNTASGKNAEITRDWAGVMKDELEKISGGTTVFFNGAQGDVGPRLAKGGTTGDLQQMLAHGEKAAKDVADCYNAVTEWKKDCVLHITKDIITVPYDTVGTIDEIEALRKTPGYTDPTDEDARKGGLKTLQTMIKQGAEFPEALELESVLFSLGDFVFVPSPFESFAGMILKIRSESAFPYTLVVSNCDSRLGYFPTEEEIPRGGYEVQQGYLKRPSSYGTPFYVRNGTDYFAADAVRIIQTLAER